MLRSCETLYVVIVFLPQHVSEVIMGAPYTVTDGIIDQCKVSPPSPTMVSMIVVSFVQCDYVVHGNSPVLRDVDGGDPYEVFTILIISIGYTPIRQEVN